MPESKQYREPAFAWMALAGDVLVVAVPGEAGDWTALVGAVRGKNHCSECASVVDNGTKIPSWMAFRLFPQFDPKLWRP